MNNKQESRQSFRVVESVCLKYEVISDREFRQGLDRWKLGLGTSVSIRSMLMDIDARFNQKLLELRSGSSALAECISLLNDKINGVLDKIPDLKESKAPLARQTPQFCSIGADGMMFGADKQYPPATKIALRILLGEGNCYVETFCQVVRDDVASGDSHTDFPFDIAVKFQGMKSAQKDLLIQHLFHRESETLRLRRLQNSDAN